MKIAYVKVKFTDKEMETIGLILTGIVIGFMIAGVIVLSMFKDKLGL